MRMSCAVALNKLILCAYETVCDSPDCELSANLCRNFIANVSKCTGRLITRATVKTFCDPRDANITTWEIPAAT
jgi:hypothetical protein